MDTRSPRHLRAKRGRPGGKRGDWVQGEVAPRCLRSTRLCCVGRGSRDPRRTGSGGAAALRLLLLSPLLRRAGVAHVLDVVRILDQALVEVVADLLADRADEVDALDGLVDALPIEDTALELVDADAEELLVLPLDLAWRPTSSFGRSSSSPRGRSSSSKMPKPFFGAFAFVAAFFLPLVRGIARPLSLCGSTAKQSFRSDPRPITHRGTAVTAARAPRAPRRGPSRLDLRDCLMKSRWRVPGRSGSRRACACASIRRVGGSTSTAFRVSTPCCAASTSCPEPSS